MRSMRSSRACTSTWIVTSSGMRPSSMRRRMKANSVLDAAGKPTSISWKPQPTSASNNSSFCDTFMGTANAWFPSRRSTLHHVGACVSTRPGHWRSGSCTTRNGRYLLDAGFFMFSNGPPSRRRSRRGSSQQKTHRRDGDGVTGTELARSRPGRHAAEGQRKARKSGRKDRCHGPREPGGPSAGQWIFPGSRRVVGRGGIGVGNDVRGRAVGKGLGRRRPAEDLGRKRARKPSGNRALEAGPGASAVCGRAPGQTMIT